MPSTASRRAASRRPSPTSWKARARRGADETGGRAGAASARRGGGAAEPLDLRPQIIVRQIKKLEGEMFKRARNLEFEEAARIRDEIERLKQIELGLPGTLAG